MTETGTINKTTLQSKKGTCTVRFPEITVTDVPTSGTFTFAGHVFYLHRTFTGGPWPDAFSSSPDSWTVTESQTGMKVATVRGTKNEAFEKAVGQLEPFAGLLALAVTRQMTKDFFLRPDAVLPYNEVMA
jgi:hypothetical protein